MTRYDDATLQRLLFRRQFILGPQFVEGFPSWQRVAVDRTWCVTAHPDLDVCRVASHEKSITLLGYLLDPLHPVAGNVEILTGLLDHLHTGEDFFAHTAGLGGRWILLVNDGARTILFADAAGLRQVVYTTGLPGGRRWCASQPGLLAEVVDLPMDDEASAFLGLDAAATSNRMTWLPGDATPRTAAKVLVPNHCLDLGTGRPHRFWPDADLPVLSVGAAVARSSELLRGLMESAGRRFDLMLALTAGWDSRLTFAAARSVAHGAFCYTAVFRNTPDGAPDVTTPRRMLARLGLTHEILDCRTDVDDGFAAAYRRNVPFAHEQYGPVAQALFDRTPSEGVCVTGDVGEIAKCTYRLGPSRRTDVTAPELAGMTRMPAHPFVLKAFDDWLSGVRAHCHNVPLMDLFYWEQEAGRLQAMIQAECDIARESFAPLNCRSLLATMLAVPERYRHEPRYDFLRKLIGRLWPDVLREPINEEPQVGVEAVLRRALDDLGLLRLVPGSIKRAAVKVLRGHGLAST